MQQKIQNHCQQPMKLQPDNVKIANSCTQLSGNSKNVQEIVPVVGLTRNDSSRSSLKTLTFIKELISRQLPAMPKSYITKLLFEGKHECLHLQSDGKIIAAACFRCFDQKSFVELVFLAVAQGFRDHGLGTTIIANLKQLLKGRQKTLLLTYADQTAVGFFKKQAFYFTTENAAKQWSEYIKPYQGGCLMQCRVDKNLIYGEFRKIIKQQRECLIKKVEKIYSSQVQYNITDLEKIRNRNKIFESNPQAEVLEMKHEKKVSKMISEVDWNLVPGVLDNLWSKEKESELQAQKKTTFLLQELTALQLIRKLSLMRMAEDIHIPANFKQKLTLSMIQKKVACDSYNCIQDFAKDIRQLINQWKIFSTENDIKLIIELQKKIESILQLLITRKIELKLNQKGRLIRLGVKR